MTKQVKLIDEPAPAPDALREALKKLVKAGDQLSVAAQTTGGTSGSDDGLQEAVKGWQAAKALYRIARLEPEGAAIGAVGGAALTQPAPASEPVSKAWPSAEGAPVFDLEADAADYQRCKDDARRWEAALAALTGAMAGSAADGTPLYTPEWAAQVSLEAADALVAAMREAGQ
jgi:hypothetical protein